MMDNVHNRYQFDRLSLNTPRRTGISALMRIKNGEEFLHAAIESHLAFYDEIVAVYNGCTDNTAEILKELAARYPTKLRVFHYEPEVYPVLSKAHQLTAADSIHSMANYYNFALMQARFSYAVKLDDDHLAVAPALTAAVAQIRREIAGQSQRLYTFSGLNLAHDHYHIGVYSNEPLVGTGDILYFPVTASIYFQQNDRFEYLHYPKSLKKQYLGILYLHLKHLKRQYGLANLPAESLQQQLVTFQQALKITPLNTIRTYEFHQQLINNYSRFWFWFRGLHLVQLLERQLSNREAPLRWQRIERWQQDVGEICWQRDLWYWLAGHPSVHRLNLWLQSEHEVPQLNKTYSDNSLAEYCSK